MNRGTQLESADVSSPTESSNPYSFEAADGRLHAQRPLRKRRLQQIDSLLADNIPAAAEKELDEYLAKHPDDSDALNLMARTKVRLGRRSEAIASLERCLKLAPEFAIARYNLADLLSQNCDYDAALHELDHLLEGDDSNPLFLQMKADILAKSGDAGQALAIFEQLALDNPRHAVSWVNYGHGLRALGLKDKSIAAYRKAIEIRPFFGQAWWALADLKTVRFSDADIAAMESQLKCTDITADDRVTIQFSLGKAYEDQGAYEPSFELYAKANAAARLRINYNPDTLSACVANSKALFTPDFLGSRIGTGCLSPDPIFVIGQPRAGSTLVEQILSSHSAIEGTAELPYIPAFVSGLEESECREHGVTYPAIVGKLERAALVDLGEKYLTKARRHRKLGRPFFIDKKPTNFIHIGLIHLILPNAKIVDARRHPAACSFSVFKQYANRFHPRMTELGRGYRDYVELMAHFDAVLPGRVHRVIYENMVRDPDTEIRRLLDYLDLPFEESCLRFYETDRAVITPSSEQVRRPISGDAVDHWRHYEPWLGPLIKSLGSVVAAYPSVPEELR